MTPTPRTDAIEESDFHKYDYEDVPIACYKRMAEHASQLERELAELTEDVGKCHDVLGEDRASDTSELWKFFETRKQISHRLRCREEELAAEREQLAANHEATTLMGRWLESERALADRLAGELEGCAELTAAHEALAAWKDSRSKV